MPRSRRVSGPETSQYRFALADVFWVLLLVTWTAFGIVSALRGAEQYRWQQNAMAEFETRMPKMIGKAPYDPAAGERLIGEAAGCVLTAAVVIFSIRRRRRRAVEVRVKWTAASRTRAAPVKQAGAIQAASIALEPATKLPVQRARKTNSGSLAADRLSVVVWSDHVARLEKERA